MTIDCWDKFELTGKCANVFQIAVESHLGGDVVDCGVKMDKFTEQVEVGGCCSSAVVSGGNKRCSTVAGLA